MKLHEIYDEFRYLYYILDQYILKELLIKLIKLNVKAYDT